MLSSLRSRLPILLAAALVASAPVACRQSSEPDPAGSAAPPASRSSSPVLDDTALLPMSSRFATHLMVPLGESSEEMRHRLGAPDSVIAVPVDNRHVPHQVDTVATLHWEGLEASFYRVTGGKELLEAIEVRNNRFLRGDGIRIGMPWEDARREAGPPDLVREGRYGYVCGACRGVPEPVWLVVEAGIVRALYFAFYVD